MLDAAQERTLARSRREASIDGAPKPLHVQEHVDRHHKQEDGGEERLADRDRGALDEVDDPVRVAADVTLADPLDDPVADGLGWYPRAGGSRRIE